MGHPVLDLVVRRWLPPVSFAKFLCGLGLWVSCWYIRQSCLAHIAQILSFALLRTGSPVGRQNDEAKGCGFAPKTRKPAVAGGLFFSLFLF